MPRGKTARAPRRGPKESARRTKKKPCALCRDRVEWVDYKNVALLRRYVSDRGKIRARRVTGNCARHQREVARAVKTARELVLLPYTQRTMTERSTSRSRGPRVGPGGGPAGYSDGPRSGAHEESPARRRTGDGGEGPRPRREEERGIPEHPDTGAVVSDGGPGRVRSHRAPEGRAGRSETEEPR
jgi:small subunit ribosomal protein S18